MFVLTAAGVGAFTLLLVYFIYWKRKYNRMPPGPTPLPVIGNLHQINDSKMAVDLTTIGRKYGDLFTVYFFMTPAIVINSHELIKELVASSQYSTVFAGRPVSYFGMYIVPDDMASAPHSDEQMFLRRLVMRGVKQYGTALKRVEQITKGELEKLIARVRDNNGVAFDPMFDITQYTSNIIMILVSGESFHPDHMLMRMVREMAADFDYIFNYKRQMILDAVPLATVFPSKLKTACERIIRNKKSITTYFMNMRKDYTKKHQECLLELVEEILMEGKISSANMEGIITDMVIAGVITTTPTIYSCFLVLASSPEVQRKIQEEIHRAVGDDRIPCLDDKPNLPYTQATLLEIFRYYTPSPLPGPRSTTCDFTYQGYFIPKNTFTMYNAWHVHHDEEFWDEPYKFDPTRFLDSKGDIIPPEDERRQRLLTFGVGKRSCVGEVLARVRIFLVITAVLQNFDLVKDPSLPFPSPDPRTYHIKFITTPPAYKIRFVPRK